jgi:hypothetical protein
MIQVNPASSQIGLGLSDSFTAIGIYSDGSRSDLTSQASWSSSDPNVLADAGYSNGSEVMGTLNTGTAIVSASFEGMAGTASIVVSCPEPNTPGFSGGDGSIANPYLICSGAQLPLINVHTSASFKVISDFTWDSSSIFYVIGTESLPFTGSFDGAGHVIHGIRIQYPTNDNVGFFGVTSGTIHNLKLDDIEVVGQNNVGSIAGLQLGGSIDHCEVTQAIVSGTGSALGGLVGTNGQLTASARAMISRSSVTGSVTSTSSSGESIGGLVGLNQQTGDIINSYSLVVVAGGTANFVGGLAGFNNNTGSVSFSYSAGKVTTTGANVGGFIGANNASTAVVEDYYDRLTSQINTPGTLVPSTFSRTTSEMYSQANYAGWDFTNVWTIDEGNGYPALR